MFFKNKSSISKEIKKIRKEEPLYEIHSIISKMEKYYNDNDFDNKLLLERLWEIETDGSFRDILFSAIVGTIIGIVMSFPQNIIDYISKLSEYDFIIRVIAYIFIIFFIIVISIATSFVLHFLKWLFKKAWKTDSLDSFINEKEKEIIKNLLNDRILNKIAQTKEMEQKQEQG